MKERYRGPRHASSQQRGAVLITSMLILLVVTLISVTGMQTSILDEKLAGNFRDSSLAFQAAEAALRDAETDIRARVTGLNGFNTSCTGGLCNATSGLSEVWKAFPAQGVSLGSHTGTAALSLVACQPRYWIEGYQVWPPGNSAWRSQYRITTIACGGDAKTKILLQSVYQ